MKYFVMLSDHIAAKQISGVILLLTIFLGVNGAENLSDNVVSVGSGGYRTSLPAGCKPLPKQIFKTDDMPGAMLTGQWWSSLVWQPLSQPLFAHPLSLRCTGKGLVIDYPGSKITANEHGIFGNGASKNGDICIGHSNMPELQNALCAGYSDWFVTAAFEKQDTGMRMTFGHGSPYVFATYKNGEPVLSFSAVPRIWAGSSKSAVIGITINDHHYGLFGATGSTWTGTDGTTWKNSTQGKRYFSLALLPDNKTDTLASFQKYAYNHVIDSRVTYKIENGYVESTYVAETNAMEGTQKGTVYALYPHQWKYCESTLTGKNYNSVRGVMKICEGEKFKTSVPVQGVLPMLPAQGIQDKLRMRGYLQEEAKKEVNDFKDTYWEGKRLGLLTTLSGIAEVCESSEVQNKSISELKMRLENWFTAQPAKDQPTFYYNADWGTLIGSKPSFGSDFPLNDHHFHYGYFIRAAAEIARIDSAWAKKWGPMVNMVIRDIASTNRKDGLFPYLRCFDKYAGHSWASGDANFGDGNNQESSSESMNAWYGMILWGLFTDNEAVKNAGIYLYNTERTAIEEYWFDVSDTNYPKEFPHEALGMIWGGKGAFATWFSGDADCIHGINWLPFTPASVYMGRYPMYVKRNHDQLVTKRKAGKNYNAGWGDLVVMFNALQDPQTAVTFMNANPQCSLEGGNSHAFMYHWIHTLNNLGLNDGSVTADYPLVNVFVKAGKKSYAVYNTQNTPLRVMFSDGKIIKTHKRGLIVE